jgi:hypothetical protein
MIQTQFIPIVVFVLVFATTGIMTLLYPYSANKAQFSARDLNLFAQKRTNVVLKRHYNH